MSNINLNWSQKISDTFYALGVKHICICPGARNTPLTLSFIKNKKFISTSHIDERSAAFFALGLSKKTGSPSIIITTSGTAVANLYPAIIESNYSKTPFIAPYKNLYKTMVFNATQDEFGEGIALSDEQVDLMFKEGPVTYQVARVASEALPYVLAIEGVIIKGFGLVKGTKAYDDALKSYNDGVDQESELTKAKEELEELKLSAKSVSYTHLTLPTIYSV